MPNWYNLKILGLFTHYCKTNYFIYSRLAIMKQFELDHLINRENIIRVTSVQTSLYAVLTSCGLKIHQKPWITRENCSFHPNVGFKQWFWYSRIKIYRWRNPREGNLGSISSTTFTHVDPKSIKTYWWLDCLFYAFGLRARKSCT